MQPMKRCSNSTPQSGKLEGIVYGAAHPETAFANDMGIDFRGPDVCVAQQFLDRPDVVPGFQQAGGKAVPECVAVCGLASRFVIETFQGSGLPPV